MLTHAGTWGTGAAMAVLLSGAVYSTNLPPGPPRTDINAPYYHVGTLLGTVTSTTTEAARHLYVYRKGDSDPFVIMRADRFGHFGTTLEPGGYTVSDIYDPDPSQVISISITEGTTTDISIDTSGK